MTSARCLIMILLTTALASCASLRAYEAQSRSNRVSVGYSHYVGTCEVWMLEPTVCFASCTSGVAAFGGHQCFALWDAYSEIEDE